MKQPLLASVEPLEGRRLLSVAPTDGLAPAEAAEPTPPTVRLLTRPLVTSGAAHTFHLVVSSAAGLSTSAVGSDDILVTGPKGFSAPATVTGAVANVDGTRLLVTCRVAAPGGSFDRADNGVYRVDLKDGGVSDNAGVAAPARRLGGFRVIARRPTPAAPQPPALPLGTSATAGALSVSLNRVDAWCDHMPTIPFPFEMRRQYLLLNVTLTNTSDAPLEVRLDQAYWSFDAEQVGTATDGISIKSPSGPPSGVKTVTLQPGERRNVAFRGDGVFPEDRHGQRLYITLQFSAAGATAAVRNSGVVGVTW